MNRQRIAVIALADRHAFIKLSDRIALITKSLKRPGKDGRRARVVSAYFGFHSRSEAQSFVAGLKKYFPRAYCQIRVAERLNTLIEVKVRDFPALEKFVWMLAAKPEIVTPAQAKADISPVEPASNVVSFPRNDSPVAYRSNRPLKVAGLAIE